MLYFPEGISTESPESLLLAERWHQQTGFENVVSLDPTTDGTYGTLRIPDEAPSAILSTDIDDVLRALAKGIMAHKQLDENDACLPGQRRTYYAEQLGLGISQDHLVHKHIVHISEEGSTPPVAGYRRIRHILKELRQNNVYVVATTSAVSGSELGVMRYLQNKFAGTIDGVMFAGAYDGAGVITKASAILKTRQLVGANDDVPTAHIDDIEHHVVACLESGIQSYLPVYRWGEPLNKKMREYPHPLFVSTDRPVHAFELVRESLRQKLGNWSKAA